MNLKPTFASPTKSPADGTASAPERSPKTTSLLKLPTLAALPSWPSTRSASPAISALELPNGRFIPESERGWSTSTPAKDKRRTSMGLSQLFAPAKLRIPTGRDEPPAAATGQLRSDLLGRAASGRGSLRSRTRSVPATPVREALRDPLAAAVAESNEEFVEVTVDESREEEAREEIEEQPVTRPSLELQRSYHKAHRRRSLQEVSTASTVFEDAFEFPTPQHGSDDSEEADEPGPLRLNIRPSLHAIAASTSSFEILSPPTPSLHAPRGYPWRDPSSQGTPTQTNQPTFVPTWHRNPTAKQAFYDTHFGASSGWRSLSSLTEPVRHPWETWKGRRGPRAGEAEPAQVKSTAKASSKSSPSSFPGGRERFKEMLSGWNALPQGLLGPSSMANDASPADQPSKPSAQATVGTPYEPELIPTVRKDPDAKRYFDEMEGNVVIMGGYRGSVLRDSETGRQMWIPIKVGVGLRRPTLEIGLSEEAEANSEDLVIPDGSLLGIGRLVDMGGRLVARCAAGRKQPTVHSWGYDWRLSLWRSSARLERFLVDLYEKSGPPGQRRGATVVAHSMGGLVALHALATTANPRIFASLVFASTPFSGTANMLGPFRYGDAALYNDEICSPRATFSFRSSFGLLPRDGRCFEDEDGKPYDLDFFDEHVWDDMGLSPCIERGRRNEFLARLAHEESDADAPANGTAEATASPARVDHAAKKSSGLPVPGLELSPEDSHAGLGGGASNIASAASKAGHALDRANVLGEEKFAPENRQETGEEADEKHAGDRESAAETWAYLRRTLAETRQFHKDLDEGFKQEHYEAGAYPPIAVLASGRTPTVRGCLARSDEHPDAWKEDVRAGDYSRMLYEPGDGVITLRSSMTIPGRWEELLVPGDGDLGEFVTTHRHVTLLSDVQGVGRCIHACLKARQERGLANTS